MKAALITLGCKVNQYDTTAMQELLTGAGYDIVPFDQTADVYIINTCTVTNIADKKSRNMIRRAAKKNPDAVICVCGCLPQKKSGEILSMEGVDAVVGTSQRSYIVQIIEECKRGKRVNAVGDIKKESSFEELFVTTSGEMTRGYIKIQEGCNHYCSYCIIPYVRGRVRSRPVQQVREEAARLAARGIKEVVLTGICISSYGEERGETLAQAIREVNAVPGIIRIRLGSLSPQNVDEAFLQEIASCEKLCPHFHLSMQSGSDTVLDRMNRHYTTAQFWEVVQNIRRHYKAPAITTDIITGFPKETEEEFEQTVSFVKRVGFSQIHVFPYSEREGTKAALMDGSVASSVRKSRANELILLGKKLEKEYRELFLGTVQQVLLEQEHAGGKMEGYTDRYLRVLADGKRGEVVNVLLLSEKDGTIIGKDV